MLYLYMRDHWFERAQLAALGIKDIDAMDDLLTEAEDEARRLVAPQPVSRAERSAAIARLVAEAGG